MRSELYRQLLKARKIDTFIDDLWESPRVQRFTARLRSAFDSQIADIKKKTIREAVQAIGKASGQDIQRVRAVIERDFGSLDEFISVSDIQDFLVEIYDVSGNHVLDKFELEGSFELKNPGIIQRLADQAKLLIRTVDDTTKEQLSKILSDGVANNLSWEDIAESIHEEYPQITGYRSELIARMETANATNQAELDFYKQNNIMTKSWVLASSHNVDDECDDNADAGSIGLEDVFPSGDDAPPAHINCACTLNTDLPDDFIENGPTWLGD